MAAVGRPWNEFETAYRTGLAAFLQAVERTDPKDEAAFKPILKLAIGRFGVSVASLVERTGHSNSAISKWVNTASMPPQSTREIVLKYIQLHLRHEYESTTAD